GAYLGDRTGVSKRENSTPPDATPSISWPSRATSSAADWRRAKRTPWPAQSDSHYLAEGYAAGSAIRPVLIPQRRPASRPGAHNRAVTAERGTGHCRDGG